MRADAESPATLGAIFSLSGVMFTVWAPKCKSVAVKDVATGDTFALQSAERGYFENMLYGMMPGRRYMLVLDGQLEKPDPASRSQPEGVLGPSEVFDTTAFIWKDDQWHGILLPDYIIYQVHIGTLSAGGTFATATEKLARIRDMGFTAVELMPCAQFPGLHGWGHHCVFPYAPHHAYGGPIGLRDFVQEAHRTGLAVIMNLSYPKHGVEGNCLEDFGPYYTDRYFVERGKALNFDGQGSDEVRRFFVENALYWVNDYHIDAIRITGIENIFDFSANHVLRQVAAAVHTYAVTLDRKIHVLGEADLNDTRITMPGGQGGFGFDAQMNFDFHRSLFAFATGRTAGVYADFGKGAQVAQGMHGFVYCGQYSEVRKRSHGSDSAHLPPWHFIATSETAFDIGRRPRGDRLNKLFQPGQHKMAAGLVLLGPQTPLVFQGNEYGEKRPFLYFSSFTDEEVIRREQENAILRAHAFGLTGQAHNPQASETYARCKLDSSAPEKHGHVQILRLYKRLVELRKELGIAGCSADEVEVRFIENLDCVLLFYHRLQAELLVISNIGASEIMLAEELPEGRWKCLFDSEADEYGGLGKIFPEEFTEVFETRIMSVPPWAFAVYTRESAES